VYAAQLNAYKTVQDYNNKSGREIEADALIHCAHLLSDCQNNWNALDHDKKLVKALKTNQSVWSIFQSELARPDNPLPVEIRKNILTLSVFIDNRIIQIMAKPEPEKLKSLIDINLNLAAGLCASPAE
jgi:flagellar biosynthesis activator protein FlaF